MDKNVAYWNVPWWFSNMHFDQKKYHLFELFSLCVSSFMKVFVAFFAYCSLFFKVICFLVATRIFFLSLFHLWSILLKLLSRFRSFLLLFTIVMIIKKKQEDCLKKILIAYFSNYLHKNTGNVSKKLKRKFIRNFYWSFFLNT